MIMIIRNQSDSSRSDRIYSGSKDQDQQDGYDKIIIVINVIINH